MLPLLKTLDCAVFHIIRWLLIISLSAILFLLALGIVVRTAPFFSITGYDEVIELLLAWTVFLGTVALWRESSLFKVELLKLFGSERLNRVAEIVTQLLMLGFAAIFAYQGWKFAVGSIETVPFLGISKQPWYAAMPVAGILMTLYGIAGVVRSLTSSKAAEIGAAQRPVDGSGKD